MSIFLIIITISLFIHEVYISLLKHMRNKIGVMSNKVILKCKPTVTYLVMYFCIRQQLRFCMCIVKMRFHIHMSFVENHTIHYFIHVWQFLNIWAYHVKYSISRIITSPGVSCCEAYSNTCWQSWNMSTCKHAVQGKHAD